MTILKVWDKKLYWLVQSIATNFGKEAENYVSIKKTLLKGRSGFSSHYMSCKACKKYYESVKKPLLEAWRVVVGLAAILCHVKIGVEQVWNPFYDMRCILKYCLVTNKTQWAAKNWRKLVPIFTRLSVCALSVLFVCSLIYNLVQHILLAKNKLS